MKVKQRTDRRLPLVGIHKLAMGDYQSDPGISKSALDRLRRSPREYRDWVDGKIPSETTPAMEWGTIMHGLILEGTELFHVQPATYVQDGVEKKWNGNATICKEWVAGHSGRTIISAEEAAWCRGVATAVHADNFVRQLLNQDGLLFEHSAFVTDDKTRLRLKCRPDVIGPDWVADLKTTTDASTKAFSKEIATRRYHVQAALYRRILQQLGRKVDHWYFIIVEKSKTYTQINVRDLRLMAWSQGDTELNEDLELLQQCMEDGVWPGLSGDTGYIETIDIPTWAYTEARVELQIGGQTMTL